MRPPTKRVACTSEGMSKYNNQPMPLSNICNQRKKKMKRFFVNKVFAQFFLKLHESFLLTLSLTG